MKGLESVDLPWRVSNDLASWYLVAAGDQLPEGHVQPARVGKNEIVLYRTEGQVRALAPHCAHMGARLCHGAVKNGLLTCPLHGWQYKGDGTKVYAEGLYLFTKTVARTRPGATMRVW